MYSLGVLLYELLTGALPFDKQTLRKAGYLEIQRVIREEEPPRPSTRVSTDASAADVASRRLQTDGGALARSLRGDLDWITMKALEKDPARRYQTASELALDVERHVRHEPVAAGPPSFAYLARKLVQRHRGPVLAAAGIVVALAAGLVVSLQLYFQADAAKADARTNEGIALASAERARLAKEESDTLRQEREHVLAEVSKERDAKQAALEHTRGLLLAHQSTEALAANPTLALLLGLEAAERVPGAAASNALLAAMDATHEERVLVGHTGSRWQTVGGHGARW